MAQRHKWVEDTKGNIMEGSLGVAKQQKWFGGLKIMKNVFSLIRKLTEYRQGS